MLRRLIQAVPLVLGVATMVFFLVNALPGDLADLLVAPGLSQEIQDQIRANFGLD
ncbi:MAG: diguanylate cyclase, partial [Gemmatimonadetes bacterium]|nr:diguanylate cyclase [Gemmatimonadota bacterium]